MKKVKTLILFIGVSLIFSSCTRDATIPCVHDSIQAMKNHNREGKVLQYSYHGQLVYYVDDRCCADALSTLYDANCNIICMNGGIAGYTCPDSIWNSLTNEVVIFENPETVSGEPILPSFKLDVTKLW